MKSKKGIAGFENRRTFAMSKDKRSKLTFG